MEFSCLDDVALLAAIDALLEAALFDQGDDFLAELSRDRPLCSTTWRKGVVMDANLMADA